MRELPQITERAVGRLTAKWHDQDKRINSYKDADIDDSGAHDFVIRATDVGLRSNGRIPSVLHEWRKPRHGVFEESNVWSLFNAFTESLRDGNLAELPKRTEALRALLDTHVELGLNRGVPLRSFSERRGFSLAMPLSRAQIGFAAAQTCFAVPHSSSSTLTKLCEHAADTSRVHPHSTVQISSGSA